MLVWCRKTYLSTKLKIFCLFFFFSVSCHKNWVKKTASTLFGKEQCSCFFSFTSFFSTIRCGLNRKQRKQKAGRFPLPVKLEIKEWNFPLPTTRRTYAPNWRSSCRTHAHDKNTAIRRESLHWNSLYCEWDKPVESFKERCKALFLEMTRTIQQTFPLPWRTPTSRNRRMHVLTS